jgi:hypothetical protein
LQLRPCGTLGGGKRANDDISPITDVRHSLGKRGAEPSSHKITFDGATDGPAHDEARSAGSPAITAQNLHNHELPARATRATRNLSEVLRSRDPVGFGEHRFD